MNFRIAVSLFATVVPFVSAKNERATLSERLSALRKRGLKTSNKKNGVRKLEGSTELELAQTFYLPLVEQKLFQDTFKIINPGAVGPVLSMISLSISSDGTKIYYDHWEDGYEENVMNPSQSTTEIWGDGDATNGCRPDVTCTAENDVLNAGDSIVVENSVSSDHGEGTTVLYDGSDMLGALYPVAITRGAYPTNPGSLMAGAVEVFDTKYWGTDHIIPVDESTPSGHRAFEYVGIYFMACDDDTVLSNGGTEIATLGKGESYYMVAAEGVQGQTISASKSVQLTMVTGDRDSSYELRWFTIRPSDQWSSSYLSPVGDTDAQTKVLVYNPHDTAIDVAYALASGDFTLSVAPNSVGYTEVIENDSACKLDSADTFVALSISDTEGNDGSKHDWGFPVIPVEMLTSMVLVGWGYGCTQNDCDFFNVYNARSVVWVSPIKDATVYVDYQNDGQFDHSYDVDYLTSKRITDEDDTDMSGAVIWATERGAGPKGDQVAIAAAWGQFAGVTYGGDADALDLGTVVPPFTPISATKTLVLVVDEANDGLVGYGDTIKYEIELINVGISDLNAGLITIQDKLDDNVFYIPGSTVYVDHEGNSIPIADDDIGTPFPLDGEGIPSAADLPKLGVHHIQFNVQLTNSAFVAVIKNTGTATVWNNVSPFENAFPLMGTPRSIEIEEECAPLVI